MAAGRGKLNSTGMLDNLNEQGYVPGAVTASGVAGWGNEDGGGGGGGTNSGHAGHAPPDDPFGRNELKHSMHTTSHVAENPMFSAGRGHGEPDRDYHDDSDIEPADYQQMHASSPDRWDRRQSSSSIGQPRKGWEHENDLGPEAAAMLAAQNDYGSDYGDDYNEDNMDAMSAITEAPDYHDDSDAEDHIPEPPPGGPTCADCAVANAAVHCRDCDKPFCADCYKALHKKGKKKRHDALPIAAYLGAIPKPICADCEEDDSAVFCKACNKPFCDECSAALHRHGTKAAHERVHIITYLSALPPSARQANLPKKKPPAPKGPPPSKKKRGARASQSTSAGYGRQQQKQPQQRRASNRRSDSMRQPPPQQSFRGRPPPQQQQQQSFRGQPMPPQRQQQSFRGQPMPSQRQQQQQSTRQNRQQSQRGPPPGQRAPTGPPRSLAAALGASLDHVNDDNHGLKRVGGAPTSYKGAGDIASMMAAGRG
eukprot:gene29065-29122_t